MNPSDFGHWTDWIDFDNTLVFYLEPPVSQKFDLTLHSFVKCALSKPTVTGHHISQIHNNPLVKSNDTIAREFQIKTLFESF